LATVEGGVVVVGGVETGVPRGAVVEAVAAVEGAVTWEWAPPAEIGAELEHAPSSAHERRPVATTRVRRRDSGTDAHHSRGALAPVVVGFAAVMMLLLASCGGSHPASAPHRITRVAPSTTSTVPSAIATTVPTTVATTVPTTVPPTVPIKTTTPPPTAPHPVTPTTAPPLLVTRLVGVGSATQVIAVSASSYGQTVATLTAFQEDATGWRQVFGPWQADIGYAGFAPPGQKREGDGRTPSGSFGFAFFFGVLADPGVQFPFRPITGSNIVWDDDPSSPLYNQWVDTTVSNPGASPEPMDVSAYDYGAVIAYNMDPTVPGAGSAIFLHVSDGGPTVGCVSLPTAELLAVLRWLSPSADPRIIMGTSSTIAP